MSTTMSTAPLASQHLPTYSKSSLTEQLEKNTEQDDGDKTPRSITRFTDALTTPKPRSLSDAKPPTLSPSPAFREPTVRRRISKDDSALQSPTAARRPSFIHSRGLSLTMPSSRDSSSDSASIPRVPLSPKLEASNIYGSPASMLPRRSRGLDYTRAATNLHHSTLAESSPDASPIAGRGMQIPQRRSLACSSVLDSPSNMSASLWSTMPERTTLSSSVSSVNMLDDSDDSDNSSDDMAVDGEREDPILTTPAVTRLGGIMPGSTNSPGMEWRNPPQPSPAQSSLLNLHSNLMSFRRARTKKNKSQHSSSSVSMNSSRPSPGPLSPGIMKSVESNGYFGGLTRAQVQSRKESLSLGTDELHLSDSEESKQNGTPNPDGANTEGPRGVIRRAVTRRSNLLPKTKGFARIKAALMEESAPADTELKREAEVIKQVQDNDPAFSPKKSPSSNPFSPDLVQRSIEEKSATPPDANIPTFTQHAERNSAGLGFWNAFDERYRTPPPQFLPRESSSAISDDTNDTQTTGLLSDSHPALRNFNRSRSRSTTPLANYGPPTAGDVARRVNNKRRREEDFDEAYTKRRAVSPGMSVASSPVLPQSPVMTANKDWGKPPPRANGGNGTGERSNSGGSISGMKRVGMQGMNETHEGLMSMSID